MIHAFVCVSRRLLLSVAFLAVAGPAMAQVSAPQPPVARPPIAQPPIAKPGDTVDHLYGLTIADPYRWMEGPNNTAFRDWLKAQGASGRAKLDASPYMAKWQTKLNAASSAVVNNAAHQRVGGRVFYFRMEQGKQAVLRVRIEDGSDKVLFDPNVVTGSAHASITGFSPSPDGKHVALNIDRGGAEITSIEFYDVDSGQKLPDTLDHIWGEFQVQWLDNNSFTYTQMAEASGQTDQMVNMRVKLHKLGNDAAADPVVLPAGGLAGAAMVPQEFPVIAADPSSDWALLLIGGARAEGRVCVAPKADVAAGHPQFRCLVDYADEVTGSNILGNTLYLISVKGAPNGRVLAIDLSKPGATLADAKVVLPEDKEQIVSLITAAKDGLYVKRMKLGIDGFVRFGLDGSVKAVATPYDGAAYLVNTDTRYDGMLYSLQGWTRPKTLFSYDPATGMSTDIKLGASTPRDYSALVDTETTEATSLDGTKVPITILKPKGYKPDAKTLAIIEAYGAYGITLDQPAFDPMSLEWVADGHLYVWAGIRGGGEKGDAWRLGGKGANKHHSIEDFVAAADALGAKGYSDAKHVALYSASAGGIIVGGAIDRFPTHFGAAISHAGMLNPTRLASDENGANQYSEFGDPTTEAGFKSLYAMDAYVNLKPHVAYPAVMLDVGLNDNRVAPWNSGKFGARLLADNDGPNLILFRTDADAGHFGTSLSQAAAEQADHYTFVEMTLGERRKIKPIMHKRK